MIALDHGTITLLRRHLDAHQGDPADYMFLNVHGHPIRPDALTSLFRLLNTRSELPPIRLHDLRHGAASLSLAAGANLKTVQHLLGHSSIVLTADTYVSVLPSLAHDSAEATARLILGAACATGTPTDAAPPAPAPAPPTDRRQTDPPHEGKLPETSQTDKGRKPAAVKHALEHTDTPALQRFASTEHRESPPRAHARSPRSQQDPRKSTSPLISGDVE
ncbi:tyrosine-type recombinase/integrase [Amycolatopsis japonica]|uniref:tyrosine-type recombinase/integrase n=1 Tax=Amycolatopsis japonica TaxID=208439 RepID=UPI0033CE49E6